MILKTLKAQFAAEFIDLPQAAAAVGVTWEWFQIALLNNSSRFSLDRKSRQVGWSFTAAVDAVADGAIYPGNPHIFVSINLDEAKEKIRYTKAIIEAMDEPVRPQIVRDSLTEIELVDGTRFISHPCTPVRGKPKARVYLDEMAHYKEGLDRQIYLAALPSTTKGDGYIRLGSSTAGGSGLFWEIDTGSLKDWPGFDGQRRVIYWWLVRALCTDVPTANQVAPALTTHDRVYRFGTTALIEIFENMFIEDFQQEYECAYVDEASAWISWDLIKRNQANPPHHYHARSVDEALGMIPLIQEDIQAGLIEYSLVAGIDVGRHKNLTELIVLGKTTTGQFPVRFMVSLDRVEYDDQKRCFVEIAKRLPFAGGLVDESGLGNHLAEDLHRETGGLFAGVTFTNEKKEVWAVQARVLAERGLVPLPLHRDLAYQIHSIKKKVTAAKNAVFDTERNEKHHADKFWAWALALWAGSGGISPYKTWVS